MTKEVLKMALEALETSTDWDVNATGKQLKSMQAITALRTALAQPVQHREGYWCANLTCSKCYSADFRFKHTIPPQRQWVWLTDDERRILREKNSDLYGDELTYAEAIERTLKDKNT